MAIAAKTTSQIGLHMSVAFAIMYAFTGSVAFGGIAALLEPLCVVFLLPLHDKAWETILGKLAARKAQAAKSADAMQSAAAGHA